MAKTWTIDRRTVLRGAGVTVALPFLEAMPAHAAAPRKRLLVFYSGNGPGYVTSAGSKMLPTGDDDNFVLSRELLPFEPHRKDLTVITGLDNVAGATSGNPGHHSAEHTVLTGADVMPNGSQPNPDGDKYWGFGDISLDQMIANKHGEQTKLRSLEVSTGEEGGRAGISDCITSAGRDKPVSNLRDPARVWDRLFATFTSPTAAAPMSPSVNRLLQSRKSVLDVVKQDYARLRAKLGRDDDARLDKHLTALRELERELDVSVSAGAGASAGCTKPAQSPSVTTKSPSTRNENFRKQVEMHSDLIAMAFACDITRVATLMAKSTSITFSWLGHTHTQHAYAHNSGDFNWQKNDAAAEKSLGDIENWFAQKLAGFVSKLKAMPEGDGTVWDNTLVMWLHELAAGQSHSHRKHAYFLLGNIDSRFRTGRVVRTSGSNNDLFVTVLNAFDIPTTTFGTARHNTRPLALG